ncbi:KCS2 [Scenedesmus sp. PABB004]|nr:KCS2 [Scenedesmus sp. PABB004]
MAAAPAPGRAPDSPQLALAKRAIDVVVQKTLPAAAVAAAAVGAFKLQSMSASGALAALLDAARATRVELELFHLLLGAALALAGVGAAWALRRRATYLVDFQVARPDDSWICSRLDSENFAESSQHFSREAVDFQRKARRCAAAAAAAAAAARVRTARRRPDRPRPRALTAAAAAARAPQVLWFGGLGNETYLPPWLANHPQDTSIEKAKLEFDLIVIKACRELLERTGVSPRRIDVVIVNCSLFCPTPSLAAHVMHHFGMPATTMTYNLGGMGCSGAAGRGAQQRAARAAPGAAPIAVDLARQLLAMRGRGGYALVVSTENITQNMYMGTERSMLIPNVLFRVGGAAMLISNRRSEAWRAKYRLDCVQRTTLAGDAASFNCVRRARAPAPPAPPPPAPAPSDVVVVSTAAAARAGKALRANITALGPRVLPLSEQLAFAANLVARRLLRLRVPAYVPDFQVAAKHICIHTGGRGVVDAIQRELGLTHAYVEPSRAALYRYGNVSSSSVWYVLAFIEHFRGLRRGDKVLQIAFGSGFKCNSAVWVANRTFSQRHFAWEGFDLPAMYEDLSTLEVKLNALLEQKGVSSSGGGSANGSTGGAN